MPICHEASVDEGAERPDANDQDPASHAGTRNTRRTLDAHPASGNIHDASYFGYLQDPGTSRRYDVFCSEENRRGAHVGSLLDFDWQHVSSLVGPNLRVAFEKAAEECMSASASARHTGTLAGTPEGYIDAGWACIPGSNHGLEGMVFKDDVTSRVPFWKATNAECPGLLCALGEVSALLAELMSLAAPDLLRSLEESGSEMPELSRELSRALSFPPEGKVRDTPRCLRSHQVAVRTRGLDVNGCTDIHRDCKNADRPFGHVSAYSLTGEDADKVRSVPSYTELVVVPKAGNGRQSCQFQTTAAGRLRLLLMHTRTDLHAGVMPVRLTQKRAREKLAFQQTAIIFYALTATDNLIRNIVNDADSAARVAEMHSKGCTVLQNALEVVFPWLKCPDGQTDF